MNYSGSEQKAMQVVDEINSMGTKAIAVQANVSDVESVTNLMDTAIKEFGAIDILVNNAGITRDNLIMRMKEDEWDDVINTNLKGVFLSYKSCYSSNDEATFRSYH